MTDPTLPLIANTPMLLADILAELRGLRADLESAPVMVRQRVDRLTDDVAGLAAPSGGGEPETVELRGVAVKPTRDEVMAAHPNLTGASDIKDADGNVIARARDVTAATAKPKRERRV